ncbi:hypothetical protein C0J52_06605 [Blattella germanica]|nr:hypothetical protein C0J52_06605 [Blattella germanica]
MWTKQLANQSQLDHGLSAQKIIQIVTLALLPLFVRVFGGIAEAQILFSHHLTRRGASRPIVLDKNKLKSADALSKETANLVREFYCMDSISRLTPGRKDATSIKDPRTGKRQLIKKRYLVMTILEAFNLFKADYPEINLQKSKFYESRPQHVLLCSETPQNVCVCMYHENFKVETLSNALPDFPTTIKEYLKALCCDIKK